MFGKRRNRHKDFVGAESIAKLKTKANSESNTTVISSLQSLSALVWRSITRERSPPSDQKTTFRLAADCRSRMKPPLAEEYFGNCVHAASAEATTRELLENGIGWAAWKLHLAVTNLNDRRVLEVLEYWLYSPFIDQMGRLHEPYNLVMSGSPRFNIYGCEFGMGKAVAVRSGYDEYFDGTMWTYPGREGGSIDLELCLLPQTMTALESDEEFMNAVTEFDPLLF
ncbi:protein ENHANCED PSEUDOMONAS SUSCEPTIBILITY 1 [Vigna angularis]|uniref:protein ENHANCED PSEUDOMONAS SUSCEPTIBILITY 1 n=1 Tax=Phaseolus angularis TaxID=3914 RepID=UPI000809E20D|nr:protein ENHANCED PSEUDOMONAS SUSCEPTIBILITY 1 [Vigna angularis]